MITGRPMKVRPPLTTEQQAIVVSLIPVVERCVRFHWWKWWMRGFGSIEDAEQAGKIRLCDVARKWDASRSVYPGWTIEKFAFRCVTRHLKQAGIKSFFIKTPDLATVKTAKTRAAAVRWFAGRKSLDDLCPVSRTKSAPDAAIEGELIELLMRRLNERQRTVVKMYLGMTGERAMDFWEVAAAMGCTPQRVHQIYHAALAKMRASGIGA